jgi:hypothetical protein
VGCEGWFNFSLKLKKKKHVDSGRSLQETYTHRDGETAVMFRQGICSFTPEPCVYTLQPSACRYSGEVLMYFKVIWI